MRVGKIAAGLIAIALVACFVRNARALTLEQEQAAQDFFEAKAVSKRHRAELMKIPHVRVVTAQIDNRNEAEILVEVDDPKNVDSVMRQVPSRLEGFPVEVDEGQSDDCDESDTTINCLHVGHWGAASTPIPPTNDQQGYYHHAWSNPSAPATKLDAPQ
jgi:hypothetical protein